MVIAIFADAAFAELFHKLYCSEEWQGGVTSASILATLGDYFEDYETLIEPSWFKRCVTVTCARQSIWIHSFSLEKYIEAQCLVCWNRVHAS